MVKSWKTTAAGVLAIIMAAGTAFGQYLAGGVAAVQWEVLITAVIAGVGLIVAKDSGVTNSPNPVAAQKAPAPPAA